MILKLNQTKNSVKGDVYLAKITRMEPSLQAAFVDFGKNRNGFLPLTEIHPDYFKIPAADEKIKELSEKIFTQENKDDETSDKESEAEKDELGNTPDDLDDNQNQEEDSTIIGKTKFKTNPKKNILITLRNIRFRHIDPDK